MAGSPGANENQSTMPLDGLAYVLLAIGPIALLFRRRFPLSTLFVILGVTAVYVRDYGYGPIFLALVVAFLTAGTSGSRWHTYPVVGAGYILFVWVVPHRGDGWSPNFAVATGVAAWLLVLVAVAEIVRGRRAAAAERRRRAEAAEASAAAERRRVASEERLDIARELHDVLAHSLSLINVQAGVALELFDSAPEQARPALAAIKKASRDAIGDVHSLLDSLRDGSGSPKAPTAGISDLEAVVRRARDAGLEVSTTVHGTPRPLTGIVDVAAARITQESLTNVARHSHTSAARVEVTYRDTAIDLSIDDAGDGEDVAESAGGNGIPGMLERAQALGGRLTAGRKPGGGFRVFASLPYRHPADAASVDGGIE
ncbi:sensor histidine kinase [Rhodococcus sp. NPDC058521]|uniref:sensor histidine kinase n=1 Tax=Rhodococcus sp. NPDC058521 TaxID=3346536 RepID=UPI00364DA590